LAGLENPSLRSRGLNPFKSKVAVIGAGWAGCAAAVEATRRGHQVTLFEATRTAGGRARRVDVAIAGQTHALDNGQHILIGAYQETLKLMADLGIDCSNTLRRMPLTLKFPDGSGLKLPKLPTPLDAIAGILMASGWSWADKALLLKVATRWKLSQFKCAPHQSVADLCRALPPRINDMLIEPLCVAALNTPAERASGQVFLQIMQDALFSSNGGSNLLLPQVDLSALMPNAAIDWLLRYGGEVKLGTRVQHMALIDSGWVLAAESPEALCIFDSVVLACPPTEAARLVQTRAQACEPWLKHARALQHESIATVYVLAKGVQLAQPMLALHATHTQPAQFVFDRGQLGGPAGLLAFVVSASVGDSATLAHQVTAQANEQLGLKDLQVIQTIVDKRATFACTPGLQRPGIHIAPGLLACGDYVDGPYPATLEGAVRSGLNAARLLN